MILKIWQYELLYHIFNHIPKTEAKEYEKHEIVFTR